MAASTGSITGPAQAQHTPNAPDIGTMAERLAERLKTQPDDAQGWAILARSYDVMGQLPDALIAYKRAIALLPDDQMLIADYNNAIAKANQGNVATNSSAPVAVKSVPPSIPVSGRP